MIALAIVKPWDLVPPGSPRPAGSGPEPIRSAVPSQTAAAAVGSGRARCFSRKDWRLVTVERTENSEIRTWIAVQPVAAAGATDARVPSVRVVSGPIRGVGYCAPDEVPQAGLGDAVLWRLQGAGAQAIQLGSLESLDGDGDLGRGEVFAPPDELRSSTGGWPDGRYVLEIPRASSLGASLWFGFRLVSAPTRGAVPSSS